ncbi:MAG: S41 family peptidase, partial [Planctomycetota bacterium]
MVMKHTGRLHRIVLGCGALIVTGSCWAQDLAALPPASLSEWSAEVWNSARRGDQESLSTLLKKVPAAEQEDQFIARFRSALRQHETSRDSAESSRVESRDEALAEMSEHVEAAELAKALRSAIQVQDLYDDFDDVFKHREVHEIVAWAKTRLPMAEQANDWLEAQELLFLLRTLYEDTDQTERYTRYAKELDGVNRRVSLLAEYAPARLHELRAEAALRNGDEALGPFNPATAVDWREKVEAIDHKMLKQAMRIAARDHIETSGQAGWRMLMEGGLEALVILASTPGLDDSFPSLGRPEAVQPWVEHVERELEAIKNAPDDDLDSFRFSRLLDGLLTINERTVRLPARVIYREFGDGAVYKFDEEFDDPYSEIIWPDKVRRFRQATEGNFIGVGILIRHDEKRQIMVVNPLEGTPAYFAGVKPNDLILEVDGEPAVGWSLNDAVDRITGPKGKQVTLGIKRDGEEDLVQIAIERDVIKLRTVKGWWKSDIDQQGGPEWDWFIDPISRIAYVRLTQFTEDTFHDLRKAWMEINADGRPNGFILDLRYNPGGLLTSAVDISNLFVQEGIIVSGEDKFGRKAFPDQRADARRAELFGVPTVALVNKGSASASEIVAGCLQAHGAAVVVGERSYGKGSVQTVHHIDREARLKLTTHYYRLPPTAGEVRGRLVHKRPGADMWGVEPDIDVKMTTQQVVDSLELRQKADILPEDP